jgi:putative transcriptional regulator
MAIVAMEEGVSPGRHTGRRFLLFTAAILVIAVLAAAGALHSRAAEGNTVLCSSPVTAYSKPGNPLDPGRKPKSSGGVFLVADKQLADPMFMETVVFLLTFDEHGAVGIIINRPTNVKLSAVFPEIKGLLPRTDSLFIGGPVDMTSLLMLFRSDKGAEGSHRLFDNVYISAGDDNALKRIIKDPHGNETFRIYAGYSGWAPGQLEYEISRGDWHIAEADAKFIFDKDASSVWPDLKSVKPNLEVSNHNQKLSYD